MKFAILVFIGVAIPATAQVLQQDKCVGLYGFARDDCMLHWQSVAQEAERQKQQLLLLQQELLREQLRGQQLYNETLRRNLEAQDAAKKPVTP